MESPKSSVIVESIKLDKIMQCKFFLNIHIAVVEIFISLRSVDGLIIKSFTRVWNCRHIVDIIPRNDTERTENMLFLMSITLNV